MQLKENYIQKTDLNSRERLEWLKGNQVLHQAARKNENEMNKKSDAGLSQTQRLQIRSCFSLNQSHCKGLREECYC